MFFKKQLLKYFAFQAPPSDDTEEEGEIGNDIPSIEDVEFDKLLEIEHKFEGDDFTTTRYGDASLTRKRTGRTTWEGCASIDLKAEPKKMMDMFWDVKTRYMWDPMYGTNRIVKRRADGTELVYVCARAPPFIQRRDFLQLRRRKDSVDGVSLAVFLHHEHADFPPRPPLIRGKVKFSGLIARPLKNGKTRFSLVSYPDVGAPVPTWIVNLVAPIVTKVYYGVLNRAAGNYVAEDGLQVEQKIVQDKKARKLEKKEERERKKESDRLKKMAKKKVIVPLDSDSEDEEDSSTESSSEGSSEGDSGEEDDSGEETSSEDDDDSDEESDEDESD